MTQKDAVFIAVTSILSNAGVDFEVGTTNIADVLTKPLRSNVANMLVSQFQAGDIVMSVESQAKLTNNTELRAYVSGLISNWLKKDNRLNGGVTVKATRKSSGVRTYSSDPQIKALQALLKVQVDQSKKTEIQGYITKRLSELSAQS